MAWRIDVFFSFVPSFLPTSFTPAEAPFRETWDGDVFFGGVCICSLFHRLQRHHIEWLVFIVAQEIFFPSAGMCLAFCPFFVSCYFPGHKKKQKPPGGHYTQLPFLSAFWLFVFFFMVWQITNSTSNERTCHRGSLCDRAILSAPTGVV